MRIKNKSFFTFFILILFTLFISFNMKAQIAQPFPKDEKQPIVLTINGSKIVKINPKEKPEQIEAFSRIFQLSDLNREIDVSDYFFIPKKFLLIKNQNKDSISINTEFALHKMAESPEFKENIEISEKFEELIHTLKSNFGSGDVPVSTISLTSPAPPQNQGNNRRSKFINECEILVFTGRDDLILKLKQKAKIDSFIQIDNNQLLIKYSKSKRENNLSLFLTSDMNILNSFLPLEKGNCKNSKIVGSFFDNESKSLQYVIRAD